MTGTVEHPVTAEIVYRSDHPHVLETWAAAITRRAEQGAALVAYAREVDPERLRGWVGFAPVMGSGESVVGLQHKTGWTVPAGWRVNKGGYVVPSRNTRAGRTASERLDALQPSHPLYVVCEAHDMSPGFLGGHRWYSPGVADMAGALWVSWGKTPPREPGPSWERVPLSVYYAATEAHDAAAAEATGSPGFATGTFKIPAGGQLGVDAAVPLHGPYLADQSCHHAVLWVAALIAVGDAR